jgi:hypothetical protein
MLDLLRPINRSRGPIEDRNILIAHYYVKCVLEVRRSRIVQRGNHRYICGLPSLADRFLDQKADAFVYSASVWSCYLRALCVCGLRFI